MTADKKICIGVIAGFLFFHFAVWAIGQTLEDDVKTFMRPKLHHSQDILKGLMERDYKSVEVSAKAISELSKQEQFHVLLTEDYVKHNDALTKAADQLADDAKAARVAQDSRRIRLRTEEKPSEKLLKDYSVMLDSCVKCHNYMRDRK